MRADVTIATGGPKAGARIVLACVTSFFGAALAQSPQSTESPPDEREARPERLERATITGTRLTGATAQSAQEVRTYDRARIERSGQSSLADFLATVPEVSLYSVESTFGATSVRLRGAREGSALILVNGQRVQAVTGSGALIGFFDLNTIPLSMVDRIEILPHGSSAIYGGDALTGVVNIVLRSDLDGAEATVGYRSAKGTHEKVVTVGGGWKHQATRAIVMGSYSDRDPLLNTERDLTANSDLRRLGGPNMTSAFFGVPATIFAVAGNLPGLNSGFAAVPRGSTGVGLTPADFAATAGTQNLGSFNQYQSILNDVIRRGLFARIEHRLGTGIEVFAEFLVSDFDLKSRTTPSPLLMTLVPATNAFNPFGTDVLASGVVQGMEPLSRFTFRETLSRPLVGVRGGVGAWDWQVAALHSRDWGSQIIYGQPDGAALTAALAASDPASALNPFVDGPMGSPALLASIYSGVVASHWRGHATVLNGFVRGPLLRLPAGDLDAVFGAEFEESRLKRDMDSDRSVGAGFAELRAPLIAGVGRPARRELLALQVAARSDNYSDFGSKTTWQAGAEFRPVESLLLRATHATAFKPPTLYNLGAAAQTDPIPVIDPRRNGETVVVAATQGGNPNLDPITGESSTVGAVWSPIRGLNASLTWWTLRIDNTINLPGTQFIVDNEALYPGRVVRAPASGGTPGQIASVDHTYINFGTMREEGVDASADWTFKTAWGEFSPAVAASWMTKFEGQSTPGGPVVDRLSRASRDGVFAPRLKGVASIGWSPNPTIKASLAGRYTGRYTDYTPPRRIGNFWYFDAALELAIGRMLGVRRGSRDPVKLLVTGTNLADRQPPYSTHFRGYDVYNYDIVGRTIFTRLQVQL